MFNLSLGIPETREDRMLTAWIHLKERIAHGLKKDRKTVLVGGSSVLYGLGAKQLEQETGQPTVNFGLHAALPLYYLLNEAKGALCEGDTLILSLEWQVFTQDETNLTEVFVGYLLGDDPKGFRKLKDGAQWEVILASKASRILLPIRFSEDQSEWFQWVTDGWVAKEFFNDRGDYLKNTERDRGEYQRKVIENMPPMLPGYFKINFKSLNWSRFKKFLKWCHGKDIRVLYVFPPMMDIPEHRLPEVKADVQIFAKALEAEGVTIVLTQEESLYPKDWFFDSFYHLTSDARKRRTDQLLEKIRPLAR